MNSKFYTGAGARRTPCEFLLPMKSIASALERVGFVLRSGGAAGADLAFESGVYDAAMAQIFNARGPIPREAFEIAEAHHPAWRRCSGYARRCHARNSLQVLGADLQSPSEFVVCWTPGARVIGGTGQTIRVAEAYDVQVYNIADPERLRTFLQDHLPTCPALAST